MKTIYKNAQIFFKNKLIRSSLLIENGFISKIDENIDDQNAKIFDAKNFLITPNFIDMHVHARNPGFEKKETLKTLELSTLAGGWTKIVAMGNVSPCPDNVETYLQIQKLFKDLKIDVIQVANVSKKLQGKELTDFNNLSLHTKFFTDDGSGIQNKHFMQKALLKAKETDVFLLVHEEDHLFHKPKGFSYENPYAKKNNLDYFDTKYEWKMIERDVLLNKEIQTKLHIQHISTAKGVKLLEKYKKFNVTGEVTFNHLILDTDMIVENDANYKINPPLPLKKEKEILVQAVKNGVIDIIVTDHAPHEQSSKEKGLIQAPFGMIGNQICFSCLYTYLVLQKKLDLETVIRCLSINPAKIFFNENVEIQVGKKANLNVIDLEHNFILKPDNIYSLSKNTPFINKKLTSKVITVYKNGEIIFTENSIL